jgi:hypothetical protein
MPNQSVAHVSYWLGVTPILSIPLSIIVKLAAVVQVR